MTEFMWAGVVVFGSGFVVGVWLGHWLARRAFMLVLRGQVFGPESWKQIAALSMRIRRGDITLDDVSVMPGGELLLKFKAREVQDGV